jgi:hypothetical protein
MKLKSINRVLIVATLISLGATGCLKDKEYDNGSIQSVHATGAVPKVVELKLNAASASNSTILAVNNSNQDTTVNFVPVVLATAGPAPQDIHVTVTMDPSVVDDYNSSKGTNYSVPSSSMYSIVSNEVVIPKGSNTGYLQLKFKPSDYLGLSTALGFKITAIQEQGYTISGNLSKGIAAIVVKNEWDGNYGIHVSISGNNAYSGTVFDDNVKLSTVNANTVSENDIADFFGGYTEYTFNSDGTISVGAYGSAGGSSYGASVVQSSYDKSTHNFHVKFTILNGKYIFDLSYTRK